MKFFLPLALLLATACAPRRWTVPPLFPPNTTFQRCWTSQDSKYWECDYVVENDTSMHFKHKRVPR